MPVNTVEKPHTNDAVKFLQPLFGFFREPDYNSGDDIMVATIPNVNISTTLIVDSGSAIKH